jgi:ATP-dependent DNA ligase
MPPKTILLGELVTLKQDKEGSDIDDFNYVASIVKSKKDLALDKQDKDGHLGYCIWDIAFWDGECWLQTHTADERFEKLTELMLGPDPDSGSWVYPQLRMPEIFYGIPEEELLDHARKHKWEGWVVIEKDGYYGDRAYNFHGKAERPKEVGKLKPMLEGDFIARWDPDNGIGAYGKGKKSGGVGAAHMYLWDPVKKEEVFVCEVGGGLTDAQVAEFANPKRYPRVWQVEFVEWTPKGALWHATFLRERDDKTPEECEISQRPGAEEEG